MKEPAAVAVRSEATDRWIVRSLSTAFGVASPKRSRPPALVVMPDRERRFVVAHALWAAGYEVRTVHGLTARVLGDRFHVVVLEEDARDDQRRLAATMLKTDFADHVLHLHADEPDLRMTIASLERQLSELEGRFDTLLSAPSVQPTGDEKAPCSCRRLLVVDDDPDIRATLSLLLDLWGYEVTHASDGHEALDALARDPRFAAILLDLRMPGMDGWAFRGRQLVDPTLRDLPVIAVTAERVSDAAAIGARQVLNKPFDAATLEAALEAHARCSVCRIAAAAS